MQVCPRGPGGPRENTGTVCGLCEGTIRVAGFYCARVYMYTLSIKIAQKSYVIGSLGPKSFEPRVDPWRVRDIMIANQVLGVSGWGGSQDSGLRIWNVQAALRREAPSSEEVEDSGLF